MPSGAKKRKAAKRKKAAKEEAHVKSSHENDELQSHVEKENESGDKSHDEKESDGGELNSPTPSQDSTHRSELPFGEGDEEKRDASALPPIAPENKGSEDKLGGKAIKVDDDPKTQKSSEEQNVASGRPKPVKETEKARSLGSDLRTGTDNLDNGKKKDNACQSRSDIPTVTEVPQIIGTAQTTEDHNVVSNLNNGEKMEKVYESTSKMSQNDSLGPDVSATAESPTTQTTEASKVVGALDKGRKKEKVNKVTPDTSSHKDTFRPEVPETSKVHRVVEHAQTTEACNVTIDSSPVVDSSNPAHSLREFGVRDTKAAHIVNIEGPGATNPGCKENEMLPSLEDFTRVPQAPIDLESRINVEEVLPLSDQNGKVSSGGLISAQENDVKALHASDVLSVDGKSNIVEHERDLEEIPQCSEKQPLVAPRVEKSTSWMSCCGLFDVLAGSDR